MLFIKDGKVHEQFPGGEPKAVSHETCGKINDHIAQMEYAHTQKDDRINQLQELHDNWFRKFEQAQVEIASLKNKVSELEANKSK